MQKNISLGSNGVDRVPSLRKIPTRLRGTNFCTRSAGFPPSFVRQPNGPECTQWYETHQNISLVSNGVDRVCSYRKIRTRLRGTNFCTSFPPSFVRQPNGPECTRIVRNTPKQHPIHPMGWIGCFGCEKFHHDFVARTFALVRPVFHRVS